jgi:hypothetical protein
MKESKDTEITDDTILIMIAYFTCGFNLGLALVTTSLAGIILAVLSFLLLEVLLLSKFYFASK